MIPAKADPHVVSVIVPARNEAGRIGQVVRSVLGQASADRAVEVVVVDDASGDDTARQAELAGARVVALPAGPDSGNPARARNRGAAAARGDTLVFLDCDCIPRAGWLAALLAELDRCELAGGPLALPPSLALTARLDYYCGWYHVHERRPAGPVSQHPPGNLGVRRNCFERTAGFVERQPIAYAHEELLWQAQAVTHGARFHFVPAAIVDHYNRPGLRNLLARNYRWGYSALPAKCEAGNVRWPVLYRHPAMLILLAPLLAPLTALYIGGCWIRARRLEPLLFLPLVLAARAAWSAGLVAGGLRWLAARRRGQAFGGRPRWE